MAIENCKYRAAFSESAWCKLVKMSGIKVRLGLGLARRKRRKRKRGKRKRGKIN